MTPPPAPFAFDNTFQRLSECFFARTAPTPVAAPHLIALNRTLCKELGLDPDVLQPQAAEIFSGNRLPEGASPVALAYAGHQFGNFVPKLGDGRAILLGEILDPRGHRKDIQLKGSGPTPFSRRGDGRAALGPVLREFLLSEAMHAIGIPTTRALAAVLTGEAVHRESRLPGAVLTRVAASHIRIGTFEYFAAQEDWESIRTLSQHVISRHYPEIGDEENPFLSLLEAVAERQASLVARWMLVGFIHGVMNTDNMSVSGETIDYGPCAFIDKYDPNTVFSAIDRGGRYAFINQPAIAQWNLARFAETLLPLLHSEAKSAIELATKVIERIPARFEFHWIEGMRKKLGLQSVEEDDTALAKDLLSAMHDGSADFTLTFRHLCKAAEGSAFDTAVRSLFSRPELYDQWAQGWRKRLERDALAASERSQHMRTVNPAVIPRNHRVEQALAAAIEHQDFRPFSELHAALDNPFEDSPVFAKYAEPPGPTEHVFRTFCGT
jgi:uncharacterized protein YdiU (UPF0061 family)